MILDHIVDGLSITDNLGSEANRAFVPELRQERPRGEGHKHGLPM